MQLWSNERWVMVAGFCLLTMLGSIEVSDAVGNPSIWVDQWGSSRNDEALGVAFGGGGLYVAGYVGVPNNSSAPGGCGETMGDAWGCQAFVRKYDSTGNLLWSHQFGYCCFTAATGVAVNNHGVFVVGTGPVFLYNFDANGNLVWTRPGPSGVSAYGPISRRHPVIAADNESLYIIANGRLWKYDMDGAMVWSQTVTIPGLSLELQGVAVSSGAVYVVGDGANVSRVGINTSFAAKYDAQGNVVWKRTFNGQAGSSYGWSISVSSSIVYIGGVGYEFADPRPASQESMGYVASYDANGTENWIRYVASPQATDVIVVNTMVTGVVADSAGTYFAAVTSGVPNTGGILVGKFDVNGNGIWTRQLTTSDLDVANGIALDSDGIYVAGAVWENSVSNHWSAGGDDAFVIREPKATDTPVKIYSRCSDGGQGDNITCSTSVFGGNPPYNTLWDFGDGSKLSGDIVNHIYKYPGTYHVTVTVEDAHGLSDTSSVQKDVPFRLTAPANLPFILLAVIIAIAVLSFLMYTRRGKKRMQASGQIFTDTLPTGLILARTAVKTSHSLG